MSEHTLDDATRERAKKLPGWAHTLIMNLAHQVAALEEELDELRAAKAGDHEGTEVRLQSGNDELPLPRGSVVDFTIAGGGVECTVEGAGLKLVGSGDLSIMPLDSFTLDVRIRGI